MPFELNASEGCRQAAAVRPGHRGDDVGMGERAELFGALASQLARARGRADVIRER